MGRYLLSNRAAQGSGLVQERLPGQDLGARQAPPGRRQLPDGGRPRYMEAAGSHPRSIPGAGQGAVGPLRAVERARETITTVIGAAAAPPTQSAPPDAPAPTVEPCA